ncbi:glycosyltransferase family 4 protein [Bariatricus sp. SGI.154]|uniref:glycosyltransferase family 4 protein n=1 Tax=Bariatricus sp. SGI.154 TaxID=3420549 RepID=UPI003CFED1F6
MRILSISAQKPNSTGSGVYLTELVKEYAAKGHEQAVVAGVYRDDVVELPEGTEFHPVYFDSEELPYPIVGMSDEMPYKSTRYCDMTPEMARQFREAFLGVLVPLVEEFGPDLILCHHLYLLTAIVRERFPKHRVYGFCHNTDLRQMQKTDLERAYIAEQIRGLDRIFVPQEAQKEGVLEIYHVCPEKITILGMGYNNKIFYSTGEKKDDGVTRLVFAGKIAEKKGVMSLMKSLTLLPERLSDVPYEKVQVLLAGSAGNETEYQEIRRLAETVPYNVQFLGRLAQPELAKIYNASDIFVLPSFFDGLPLTIIEALACGNRVVVSDLPGVQNWLTEYAPGADVRYVPMPQMRNTDEPVPESLPEFEEHLADALADSIRTKARKTADVSRISWEGIARKVIEGIIEE